MRSTMVVLLVYGVTKALAFVTDSTIPVISSKADPIFAGIVVILGVFWTWTAVLYLRASRRSEARSSLYADAFDHPDDAFEAGTHESQTHAKRAMILAAMGLTIFLVGLLFLGFIALA